MDNKQKEIIKSLSKEIIRLGLQDNASRTTYNDRRDPDKSFSPTYIKKELSMPWHEIVMLCGFKAKSLPWNNETEDGVYHGAVDFITSYQIRSSTEYLEKCDNINYPSYWVISSKIGWKQFIIRYAFENKGITEIGIPWRELTNQQVIQLAMFEDERRKFHGARDMSQRDTSSLPNKSFVSQRFGGYKIFFSIIEGKR